MTLPQLPAENTGRARWLKTAAIVWLLLISALAVVNSVGLSRLTEQSQSSAQDPHVQLLNTRVAELEQQAATSKAQPKPVIQPAFEAARKALDERLAQLEQSHAGQAHASDLQGLQTRVGDIEARLRNATKPAAAPQRTAERAKPKVPEPPFNIVGVESRGGQRFLSVVAPQASSALNMWLLREGEAVGAWHLVAIEAHAAVFRVDGQTQRIALP